MAILIGADGAVLLGADGAILTDGLGPEIDEPTTPTDPGIIDRPITLPPLTVEDIARRLRAVLPERWFPDVAADGSSATPVLDGVLTGIAWPLAWLYELIAYTRQQTRIATATGVFLDMTALDYFGTDLLRRTGESDDAYRRRIKGELLAPKGTRAAVVAAIQRLTGTAPTVFEPSNIRDTGAYDVGTMGYGVAGAYGSIKMPFQFFVTAPRPANEGIRNLTGYGGTIGGYGVGAISWASLSQITGQVTDDDIYATVARHKPAATLAWVALTGAERGGLVTLDAGFTLDESTLD